MNWKRRRRSEGAVCRRSGSTSRRHSRARRRSGSASTVRIAITRKLRGSRRCPPPSTPVVFPTRLQRFDYFRSRRIPAPSLCPRSTRTSPRFAGPFVSVRRTRNTDRAVLRMRRATSLPRSGGRGGKLPAEIASRGSVARQLRDRMGLSNSGTLPLVTPNNRDDEPSRG